MGKEKSTQTYLKAHVELQVFKNHKGCRIETKYKAVMQCSSYTAELTLKPENWIWYLCLNKTAIT